MKLFTLVIVLVLSLLTVTSACDQDDMIRLELCIGEVEVDYYAKGVSEWD